MINKNITVGVIGLGYVGLPLMLRCAESGFSVIGFDIDANKIDQLNQGRSYIKHIDSNRIFKIW
ncbi:MAG: NAD(P)-binding domain-containing protein, partial [Dolichospermum sp.]